jgi:hypothetical protein
MNPIEIAVVPAKDGYEWLRLSYRLFRMQRLRYCALAALFILILQFAAALSGGVLGIFLKPLLSVGFLAAAWHHERGETPEVKHLFAGFRSNIKALLPLGLVYLFGALVAGVVGVAVSGIELDKIALQDNKLNAPDATILQFMLVTTVCLLPVQAALWFAPALIVFSDVGFFRALALSFQAWTRNIFAVIVYGITLLGCAFAATMLLAPPVVLLGQQIGSIVAMIVLVPLVAVLMVSDYVSYRRVFHRSERLQPATP